MSERGSFIATMMHLQAHWEKTRVGSDMSIAEFNTPEFILERGVIGEAQEALEACWHGTHDEVIKESLDVLVFLMSLYNHLGLSPEEVEQGAMKTMLGNYLKYLPENFEGRSVVDGISISRENYE